MEIFSAANLPTGVSDMPIIVGGGLVGGVCALLLQQVGIPCVLVDAAPQITLQQLDALDHRVLALNAASIHLLKRTGIWSHIVRHAAYDGMDVCFELGKEHLMIGKVEVSKHRAVQVDDDTCLGVMIETHVLSYAVQCALKQQLAENYIQDKVHLLQQQRWGWQVTLASGRVLRSPLLIGADGARSTVREHMGVDLHVWDYQQTAVTAAVHIEQPHADIARQVFLRTGPLALLPMPSLKPNSHWVSMVWSVPHTHIDDMQQWSTSQWVDALNHSALPHFPLGRVLHMQTPAYFPLIARHAAHYAAPHTVLVGDAAHVVHPKAGQGVNLGLMDAAVLADELAKAKQKVGAYWHPNALARYSRKRKPDVHRMMHGLTALGWIARQHQPTTVVLRDPCLKLTHQLGIQHWLVHQASALSVINQTQFAP